MQAITTKYHGPTDTRGSRISARAEAGRISVPYDHALNAEGNHRAAARALAARLEWSGGWVGGVLPDGLTHVYVCTDEFRSDRFEIGGQS